MGETIENERQTVKHYMNWKTNANDSRLTFHLFSAEMYKKYKKSGNMTFVTKSIALHRTAKGTQEVNTLDKEIAERLLATKQ